MSATVHEFPKADQVGGDRRGAGSASADPDASTKPGRRSRKVTNLSPTQRVSTAYRFAWRAAYRCRAGDDLGAGYRMVGRAVMAGLITIMGRVRTADFFMGLAAECALCNGQNDDGPEAA